MALVELVMAAAVQCEDKEVFLGRIMDMDVEMKAELQDILQDVLGSKLKDLGDEEEEHDDDDDSVEFEGEGGDETEPQQLFASHEVDTEVAKERDDLRTALQDARRELAALKTNTALAKQDEEAEKKKLQSLLEDMSSRCKQSEDNFFNKEQEALKISRELEECQTKVRVLQDEKATLADELDVAKSKASQLPKLEASLAAYRKKLESMGAIDQDVTSLQVQTEGYLRKIMELENENKKISALQKDMENAQNEMKRLEARYNEADESLKAKDAELVSVRNSAAAAENAKKMYQEELNELRAQHESAAEIGSPMAALSLNNSGLAEAKEKTMRLEIENSDLKSQIEQLQAEGTAANVTPGSSDMAAIAAKDAEIKKLQEDKEKLEHYTKKTLQKFQEKYLVALQDCKSKLKEKADKIEALEMRSANEKVAQKREEKLISSAVFELGLSMMQQKLGSKR